MLFNYAELIPLHKIELPLIRPKKHLGQHFLHDHNIAQKIASFVDVSSSCQVFEIGPGTGILTEYLAARFRGRLTLFEIDDEAIPVLQARFPWLGDSLVHADFLKVDAGKYFEGESAVAGNLPYNISSQIMFRILENRDTVIQVVCMVQKEVAQRIAAPHGNKEYGILSVLLQAFYDVEYLFTVGEKVFTPPPKVKSAVIRLKRNKRGDADFDHDMLRQIVKTAFNQRRKTLHNALGRMNPPVPLDPVMAGKRAEELSVEDYITLAKITASGLRK